MTQTRKYLTLVDFLKSRLPSKIPSSFGWVNCAALTAFENRIPNVSNLFKNQVMTQKISDIESKYLTTADGNKFTSQTLDAKVKQ